MENKKEKTKFEQLTAVDCSAHIDKKNTGTATLSYLSWAWAWDYFKKAYPDAKYEIKEWDGKPYLFDEKTGYMVETSITAGGETYIMWLPVMDNSNHAMLDKPYKIQTKYKTIDVAAATMFDINKNIMRCLVKNMAMFGLGLYIYAGEDLPELSETTVAEKKAEEIAKKISVMKEKIKGLLNQIDPVVDTSQFKGYESIDDVETLTNIGIALKKIVETGGRNE